MIMLIMIGCDIVTSRMDKYRFTSEKPTQSRSEKNKDLYAELYTNKVLVDFSNVQNSNAIDLDNVSRSFSHGKREEFQRNKLLNSDNFDMKSKKDYSTFQPDSIALEDEDKSYNINDVLENARKNRVETSESDKKRHLKTVEYNILSDLNQEKLKQYHEQKKKLSKAEEENLEELIHTITSNSLRKKIDDELLNDLLPTQEMETLVSEKLAKDIEDQDTEDNVITEEEETEEIDKSFYTKSMDLSEEDFDSDEDRSFVEDKGMGTGKKILLVLLIFAVLVVIGYVLFRFI